MHQESHSAQPRHLAMVMGAALLWGTVGVTTQALYHSSTTNPISIGFFRLALAVPVLLIVNGVVLGRAGWRIARRDLGIMTLIGLLLALYQACYFASIARIGVTVATLVTLCLAPVLVAIFVTTFTAERLTSKLILALTAAIAGIVCVVLGRHGNASGTNDALGILFAIGSATGYASITLAGRAIASRYHAIQITTVGFAAGTVALLGIALVTGFATTYDAHSWLLLGYLGLVPTALAYGLFMTGMRSTPATVATIATLLEPLTATLLAAILFGEQLGVVGVLGAILLIGALTLISWPTRTAVRTS